MKHLTFSEDLLSIMSVLSWSDVTLMRLYPLQGYHVRTREPRASKIPIVFSRLRFEIYRETRLKLFVPRT